MKIKNIVTVLLVAFILASCVPAAKVVPTETMIPLTTSTLIITPEPTSTPIPIHSIATLTEVSRCGESALVSPILRKLTSEIYLVTLQYPANWKCDDTGDSIFGYSGTDGFFQLIPESMLAPTAKDVCENDIQNNNSGKGNNYGTNPTMEILRVDNQPACLVLPSDDQPQNQRGFSLLVVEYPDLYEGRTRLLLLFADKNHIHDFIGSLKFIR